MIPYHSHSNTPPRRISCKNFQAMRKNFGDVSHTPPGNA